MLTGCLISPNYKPKQPVNERWFLVIPDKMKWAHELVTNYEKEITFTIFKQK
jgi:hypothetical protein